MSGAHIAIHAARERERKKEESMTENYSRQELEQNWEFKIVRNNLNQFRDPAVLDMVRQEEALGGWQLLEKLDDGRLRFKRPASAARRDDRLPTGYDPYNTLYGPSEGRLAWWIVGSVFLLALGIGVVIGFTGG